jgi:hypothetical protein
VTKDQVKAVLERVPTWLEDRQQELAEIAFEIEAELAGVEYATDAPAITSHSCNWKCFRESANLVSVTFSG